MTPEEKNEERYAEWIANNPERVAEVEKVAREGINKFLEENQAIRETDPDACMMLVAAESDNPDLYFEKLKRHYIQNEIKKDLIEKRKADHEAKKLQG